MDYWGGGGGGGGSWEGLKALLPSSFSKIIVEAPNPNPLRGWVCGFTDGLVADNMDSVFKLLTCYIYVNGLCE